jgi:hypothetical protein
MRVIASSPMSSSFPVADMPGKAQPNRRRVYLGTHPVDVRAQRVSSFSNECIDERPLREESKENATNII